MNPVVAAWPGTFGYGRDTANVSIKMAELDLLPTIRNAPEQTLIVADGTSCRHQIALETEREAIHVVEVLAMALSPGFNTCNEQQNKANTYSTGDAV